MEETGPMWWWRERREVEDGVVVVEGRVSLEMVGREKTRVIPSMFPEASQSAVGVEEEGSQEMEVIPPERAPVLMVWRRV